MEKIKELIEKRKIPVPESFVPSMKYLLVTLMPTITLFHALIAGHLEVYLAVLVFVVYLVASFMYIRLKYEKIPAVMYIVFGLLIVFVIIMYGMAYFLTK